MKNCWVFIKKIPDGIKTAVTKRSDPGCLTWGCWPWRWSGGPSGTTVHPECPVASEGCHRGCWAAGLEDQEPFHLGQYFYYSQRSQENWSVVLDVLRSLSCYITKDFIVNNQHFSLHLEWDWQPAGAQEQVQHLLSIYSSSVAGSHLLHQLKLPDVLGVSPTSHTLQQSRVLLAACFCWLFLPGSLPEPVSK